MKHGLFRYLFNCQIRDLLVKLVTFLRFLKLFHLFLCAIPHLMNNRVFRLKKKPKNTKAVEKTFSLNDEKYIFMDEFLDFDKTRNRHRKSRNKNNNQQVKLVCLLRSQLFLFVY